MMKAIISTSILNGEVHVPPSKSAMQRALALALLNNGETIINNFGKSKDDETAIQIIKDLGADVFIYDSSIKVLSKGEINPPLIINCNESGLALRMFAPIIALSGKQVRLTGTGTLNNRKIGLFEDILNALNVQIETNNGFLPLTLNGQMLPTDLVIDGSKSSQYLTGLLFAFAKSVYKPTVITVEQLVSKPYIDLSLQLLKHFGYNVIHDHYCRFIISPVKSLVSNYTYTVEGDWSSAAFFIVAAAISGDLLISGLEMNSCQSDKKIMEVLNLAGAAFNIKNEGIEVKKSDHLSAFEFDATDCPDLFPSLTVLAINSIGISKIKGVKRLFDKESNRASTLVSEFSKLGASIQIDNDDMIIAGGKMLIGANVDAHHDHRIAMALAIAGLNIEGDVIINNAESVSKSFPDFFKILKDSGGAVSLNNENITHE